MSRWIKFLIVLAIGAIAGVYYGWKIDPVEYVNTSPDSLRADYKTDLVLMVAEAYTAEEDLSLAARRLGLLGEAPPADIVAEAITYATQIGYPANDIALMQTLAQDLTTARPALEAP